MNVIEEYIKTKKNKNTKEFSKLALNKFFKCINANPNNYFNNSRDYNADVVKFVKTLNNYAPITQQCYISVIKRFFYLNDIDFKPKFWELYVKDQIEKGARPITLDDKPSVTQLRDILHYADLKGKAIILSLASSGMRISEFLSLKPQDIDLNSSPAVVAIPSTSVKGRRRPRRTFISEEAKELLIQWLNGGGRDRYLKELDMYMTGIHKVDFHDNRIFPMKPCAVRQMWRRYLIKSGLDKKCRETNRYELHIHSLRKFFMSQLKTVIPEVIVEALVGHTKYLDDAYRRYSVDEMKQYYLDGMHMLQVFEQPPDLTEHDGRITQLEKEKADMMNIINEMKLQITELRLEKLEKMNGIKK